MLNSWDKEDELEAWIKEYNTSPFIKNDSKKSKGKKSQQPEPMKRSVKYVKPGVTEVTYPHRILTYRFKQTQEEYDRAKHLRKVHSGRKGGKAPHVPRGTRYDGTMTNSQYKTKEKYKNIEARKEAARTDTKDMRALLKDEHWEEVCGHKRWLTDNRSLIREYNKYIQSRKGRY